VASDTKPRGDGLLAFLTGKVASVDDPQIRMSIASDVGR